MSTSTKIFRPHFGLVCGSRIFGCNASIVAEVVQLATIKPFPMAPEYVLGVARHNDQICTVLSPHVLFFGGKVADRNLPPPVGLLVSAPGYHSVIFAGESVASLASQDAVDWQLFELPTEFRREAVAEAVEIGCCNS